MTTPIDRRTFVKSVAAGGGAMLLGAWLGSCSDDDPAPTTTTTTRPASTTTEQPVPPTTTTAPVATTAGITGDPSARWEADLLLRVDGDETVTVTVPKSELGQGVRTALAMIVAEELDADWSRVRVITAPGESRYGNQVTGGSLSMATRFEPMRQVGAIARHMLIAAAAIEWEIDADDCTTEPGMVKERHGDRRATFGTLAGRAAEIEPPSPAEVALKDPRDFRIIGTGIKAIDAPDMVSGTAIYSSDVVVPNMVFAAVARCPVFGGRSTGYDDTAARATAGVIDVTEISTGVAVIADNTWAALAGRDALRVTWDNRGNDRRSDSDVFNVLRARLDSPSRTSGMITADYTLPYFAHATMETPACVVDVAGQRCEVWAGTQDPQEAQALAGRGSSLPGDNVTVHVPLIGGGFGRLHHQTFVEEAAELSALVQRPVKLIWSRDDDIQHDRYQPASMCRAWGDPSDPAGLRLDIEMAWSQEVPTGNWRAVSNVPHAFAHESFIDELAHAAGADPYEYRRPLLAEHEVATLDRAADAAGWGKRLPAGWGRGIAHHSMWDATPTAIVAEVSAAGGSIRVHRLVCAIDCGLVINPDTVAAQIEGGAAFAMTAALHGGVSIVGGRVIESNFHDAPIVRFDEMPQVDVHPMPSERPPTGVGEAGGPPVAPAIANAVFAATGQRLRDLPLSPA